MSSADQSLGLLPRSNPAGAHRRAAVHDRESTTQRWTVGVLAIATVALAAYFALVLTSVWLFVSAFDTFAGRPSRPVDVLAVSGDLAPVLLVGWCTGLAASAVLARGEALGPRAAGAVAGTVGALAGAVVAALTGLL